MERLVKPVVYFFFFFVCTSFGNFNIAFDIVSRSSKAFTEQTGETEFNFLPAQCDTSRPERVATVKIKGEDITVFDLYHKLRRESQRLGANSFYILKKVKDGDTYYLLCNIYLADQNFLNEMKEADPEKGSIFIISPEPVGFLNKDHVQINDRSKFTLVSGHFYRIKPGQLPDSIISIKAKDISARIPAKIPQTKYFVTRELGNLNQSKIEKLPKVTSGNGGVRVEVDIPATAPELYSAKIKYKDGSIEAGLGKLLLEFSKPYANK